MQAQLSNALSFVLLFLISLSFCSVCQKQ